MPGNLHAIAQAVQEPDEGQAQFGLLVVREFVSKKVDLAPFPRLRLHRNKFPHAVAGERGNLPVGGETDDPFDKRRGGFPRREEIVKRTYGGAQRLERSHPRHHPRPQRRSLPVVFLLQDFAPEPRHIHIGRAFGETALAGQAGVKYFCDSGIGESVAARQRFAKDVRAGAGGAQFIAGFLESGAHRPADPVGFQAGARPVALFDGTHQRVGLRTNAAGTLHLALIKRGPPVVHGLRILDDIALVHLEPKAFVHRRRVHDLVPVENALGIPAALDFPQKGIDLGSVHQRDELAAEAAVAMLAAQAPFVLAHQGRRFTGDRTEQPPPLPRLDVQDRPEMQFPRTDMAIENARSVQTFQHRAEVPHIGGQTLRRHGGVFDHADGLGVPFHAAEHTQAGLPQVPDLGDIGPVYAGAGIHQTGSLGIPLESRGLRIDLFAGIPPELGDQQRRRQSLHEGGVPFQFDVLETQFQDLPVHQFDRGGMVLQGDEIGLETALQRAAMGTDDHFLRRWKRVQGNGDFGDECQGSLASRKEFAQVGFGQGLVDGIAAAAAPEALVGIILLDQPTGPRIVAPRLKLSEDSVQSRTGRPVAGILHTHRIEIRAVGQHAFASEDMVPRGSIHQRMRPAGVVSEHTADAAPVAGGRFRRKEQAIGLQGQIELIADDAGLYPGPTLFRIDFQNLVPAPNVHDNALPHHLAGKRSAGGAGNQAGSPPPRFGDEFLDVPDGFGICHPFRHLAVGRCVSRISQAVQAVGKDGRHSLEEAFRS